MRLVICLGSQQPWLRWEVVLRSMASAPLERCTPAATAAVHDMILQSCGTVEPQLLVLLRRVTKDER